MKSLLLIALAILALPAAAGTMYRWVDAEGQVHYTDKPPPASAKDVKQQPIKAPSTDEAARLPYATQMAARNFPVTLYATDCGDPCTQARQFLRKRGIPYTEKDPQQPAEYQDLSKLLSGQMEVPVLKVGSSLTRGFNEEGWHNALDVAGYPRSAGAPPPKPATAPTATDAEGGATEAPPEAPPATAEPATARRGNYPIYSE
ncbi:MAG TPA: glutaredoxin family protein [Burkholderiales bacterium]|nr:glutaredoxin family protein [Burkholderiales bacterium]